MKGEYIESVTTISIAGIIDRNLRMDDVLYELEHFISVQAGGYSQEEFDEAAETFNDIVERIAVQIMEDVRRDKTRLADQIDSLKEQLNELTDTSDDVSGMEYDHFSGGYH
tara:strand:+ start:245 stop:577 length:333 start_codon:yes stop_codon:yes gene_type:complete